MSSLGDRIVESRIKMSDTLEHQLIEQLLALCVLHFVKRSARTDYYRDRVQHIPNYKYVPDVISCIILVQKRRLHDVMWTLIDQFALSQYVLLEHCLIRRPLLR